MDPQTWSRLRPVLEAALERPPAGREAFVRAALTGEGELVERALAMLRADARAEGLLSEETPLGARAAAARGAPGPGVVLGPWRLERELGQGGMGAVWLASRADGSFEQRAALKLVRGGLDGEEVRRRFRRERRALAALEHPGIARLIDVGEDGSGRPYLVLEHVDGRPIDAFCRERGLDLRARVELVCQVCEALGHAHRRLVVHRDLKPSNVLVDAEGRPRLLDFGIAKLLGDEDEDGELTLPGGQPHTPGYASPEQVRGEAPDTLSDVYSLGVLLYELVTGQRPYRFETGAPAEVLRVVCELDPPPPSAAVRAHPEGVPGDARAWSRRLAGDLDAIVLCALRKERERRCGSVEALAEDLRRHLRGEPVRARPDTLGYRTRKFLRRNGVPLGAAAALVLALAIGLAGTAHQYRRAERARGAEAAEHAVALERLDALARVSANLERERGAALERAAELERLSADLEREKAAAERRFAEVRHFATGLVFDVQRALLSVPGATEARARLARLGLEHLDRLAREAEVDAQLAAELAGAYVELGNALGEAVSSNLGRTAEAVEAFRKAFDLARSVEAPALPRLNGLPLVSEAGHRLSDALLVLGREQEARAVLAQVLEALGGLAIGEAASTPDLVAAYGTLDRRVRFAIRAGELEAAERDVERVRELVARIAARHPTLIAALDLRASALATEAALRRAQGDGAEQQALLEEALATIEGALGSAPDNLILTRNRNALRGLLAQAHTSAGRDARALELLEANLASAEALAAADPADRQLQRDLTACLRELGAAQLALGRASDALASFERCAQVAAAALEAEPDNVDLRALAALSELGRGRALARLDRAPEARAALELAARSVEDVLERAPGDPERRRTATLALLEAANACLDLGAGTPAGEQRRAGLAAGQAHARRGLELAAELRSQGVDTPLDAQVEQRLRAAAGELDAQLGGLE